MRVKPGADRVRATTAVHGVIDAPARASIAPRLVVIGIGADGWAGLGEPGRAALRAARAIVGSQRKLDLLPAELEAARRPWPSPIDPLIEELATDRHDGTCVLASGDPMLYGIGATLARRLDPERLVVHPHPSAFAFACARLGWPAAEVELVSAVGRPVEALTRLLQPRRRIVVYVSGADGPSSVARLLGERGLGPSRLVVLEQLGAPDERIRESTAEQWDERPADHPAHACGKPAVHPLHAVAVECRLAPGAVALPLPPGLPDTAYESDGQLTKQPVRAIALAALGPLPGELLWDVGAGSGSVGIEWLRAEPSTRAIAIEANAERVRRIAANASALGVPQLDVRHGRAPGELEGLPTPDAVFIGGGVSEKGTIERCWQALRPGGRLIANAVTLEGEQALLWARALHGGELLRIECSDAEPLGGFSGWRPRRPVVQWSLRKEGT
jgi:precorrin-6B C5,15-methyltransferase / cobalt-precorrin-6B C5,C15-methyltransferase